MDIDKELDHIIFKYNLDKYYPEYRKMRKAEELIHQFIMEWNPDERIALLFAGGGRNGHTFHAREHWQAILSHVDCKADVHVFSCPCRMKSQIYEEFYDTSSLNLIDETYNRIVIGSWQGEEFLCNWLIENRPNQDFVCIYDYFSLHELYIDHEYYEFVGEQNRPWKANIKHCQDTTDRIIFEANRQRYKIDRIRKNLNEICVKKFFFLSLVMRDFISIEIHYENLQESEKTLFRKPWKEIKNLLEKIKKSSRERDKKDILMFWIDSVSQDDLQMLPYLLKEMRQGIFFSNMWSVSHWTDPAMKALFCGKTLDDYSWNIREINSSTSPIIDKVKGCYDIVFLGCHWKGIPTAYRPDRYTQDNTPVSLLLWNSLRCLMLSKKPCFIVPHILQEAHGVMISPRSMNNDTGKWRREAIEEIDQQLHYYKNYFSPNTTCIYMSDHGITSERDIIAAHVFMSICGRNYPPHRVDSVCSQIDFSQIFSKIILDHSDAASIKLSRNYAEIVVQNLYNKTWIETYFLRKTPLRPLDLHANGYRAVVMPEYIYVKFSCEQEWILRRDKPFPFHTWWQKEEDVFDESLLPQFRKMIRSKIITPKDDPKFRYAHYLPEVIRRAMPRNLEKIDCINRMVSEFPDGSVALRMGGEYGCQLYYALRKVNRRKISCIIDNNLKCKCAAFGIPVVSQKDADMSHLRAVILCSRQHIDELKEEAKNFPDHVKVLVVEEYLVKNRLDFKYEFWFFEPSEEDWDVGFPFDEVE